jgi:hypothetical protein
MRYSCTDDLPGIMELTAHVEPSKASGVTLVRTATIVRFRRILPRYEVLTDVEGRECPAAAAASSTQICEPRSERLDIVPKQRVLTRRPRYACRTCD